MAVKLNLQQATELLSLLGVGAVVEAEANDEVDINELYDTLPIPDAKRIALRNDIEAEVKASADGRWLGALRSKLAQRFGVKTSSLSDLTIEEMLDAAKANIDNTYSASQKQMVEDRQSLINDYEAEKQAMISQHEKALADSNAKYIRRDMMQRCVQMLNGIPQSNGDITKKADALLAYIERNYGTNYDDKNGTILISDKSDPTKLILNGKAIMTDDIIADNYASEMGWKVTDTRNTPPSAAATTPSAPKLPTINTKMAASAQNILSLLSNE